MHEPEFALLADDASEDQRELLIASRDVLSAVVRRGLVEDGVLSAYRSASVECELHDSPIGRPWITTDNPFLSDSDRSELDASGLVREGTIVPMIYRLGKQPILSRLLNREVGILESVIMRRTGIRTTNGDVELVPSDSDGCETTGAEAIEALLALPDIAESGIDVRGIVQRSVYVCPPDIRPLVLLDNGNFATSDLNDHYRQIIIHNNRLSKLIDLKAPFSIVEDEKSQLQVCVDQLQANTRLAEPLLGDASRPLKDSLSIALPRLTEMQGKRVDWSAVGPMVPDITVAANEIRIPQSVYHALKCDPTIPLLVTGADRFVACSATGLDSVAMVPNPDTARFLSLAAGEDCLVHRPVTAAAVAEAQTLRSLGMEHCYLDADRCEAVQEDDVLEQIIECLWSGQSMPLNSPSGFLLGGPGGLDVAPDGLGAEETTRTEIVPLPPLPPPPTVEELKEFLEMQKRPTCVLEILPGTDSMAADAGRFGGRPWLPAGTQWPSAKGKPVPFLAQLPLEPARVAGALPIDVPRNSLLTIFWSDDWWEVGASTAPVVFIHGMDKLTQFDLPAGLAPSPTCRVIPQLRHELPRPNEVREQLKRKFQTLPADVLQELDLEQLLEKDAVKEDTRVGGPAYWIQEGGEPIVAQIVSNETAGIHFGDSGSLYVVSPDADTLFAFVQSY